jgi:hypothetical protein
MRTWLVVAGLVFLGLIVIVVPQLGGDGGNEVPRSDPDAVGAAVALTYARGVQVGDEGIACDVMTNDGARAVGCWTKHARLRSCGDFSVSKTRVFRSGGGRLRVAVGTCRIELVPGGEVSSWSVSKVDPV